MYSGKLVLMTENLLYIIEDSSFCCAQISRFLCSYVFNFARTIMARFVRVNITTRPAQKFI